MQGMSAAKWTDDMQREVQTFYLTHYRQHWCREHFSDAQQVIPTVSGLHLRFCLQQPGGTADATP